ncbi:MAG: CvpA family protein [Chloroflexota bacterium]
MNPTWMDVAILLLVGAGAFRGYQRGLIREGMAFGGLAAGLILATEWNEPVAAVLEPFIGGGRLLDALSYLLVVLAILGLATLLTVLIQRLMRVFLVGWLDRLGGAVFGAGQGAIVAALLLILVIRFPIMGLEKAVRGSEVAFEILETVPAVLSFLPPELASVADFFDPGSHP